MKKGIIMNELSKFKWPLELQRYRLHVLYHVIPVHVLGISDTGKEVSLIFKNMEEAVVKVPNLVTEYNNPTKDYVQINKDGDTRDLCIRFESYKLMARTMKTTKL